MNAAAASLGLIGACFLALVFVRAVFHKVGSYAEFTGNVRDYRIVPEKMTGVAAPVLVSLEVASVAGLVLPQTRVAAAGLAAMLLLAYAAAIASNLRKGRTSIDCGCGGAGQGISRLHLLRNGVLALFAVPVIASPPPAIADVGIFLGAFAAVTALWLTYLVFDQLLGNHTHATASAYSKL